MDIHPPNPPGDRIKEELQDRGWSQSDLAIILKRPIQVVNEIISGKRGITPETAIQLGAAFGTDPDVWLRLESQYRLFFVEVPIEDVSRRARLFSLAPLKELQRRGWISSGDDLSLIERDLLDLFEIEDLSQEPSLQAMMRKSMPNAELTPGQRAWCFRVRKIARSCLVAEYRDDRLPLCVAELRKAAAYSQETRKVPLILAKYGIRFVVVEPLSSGAKIDGMATWLPDGWPAIGLSIRFDRVDAFWHTLFHELSHIRHRDAISVDMDIADPSSPALEVRSPVERRADAEAADALIPAKELESFIKRVGPLYSKERINQLANRLKIHPGVIVGQLQHRSEIGYSANREMLVKVRHNVVPVAITDGWGNSIDPRVL